MRLSGRRISLLVICAVCVFGTIGCNKKTAARTVEKQVLPKAEKAAEKLWQKLARKLAEDGAQKVGEEGLKYGLKKFNERDKNSSPQTIDPYPIPRRNFVPRNKEHEGLLKDFNQQLKSPTTSE